MIKDIQMRGIILQFLSLQNIQQNRVVGFWRKAVDK